jgi:hypothetical protein
MADQKDERVEDKKEETEDTEGHRLGTPKPTRSPENPTGDDRPVNDDDPEGIAPKKHHPGY